MSVPYKLLALLIAVLAAFGSGYTSGYVKASDRYAPIVAEKQAALDKITADTQAKIDKQEKDNAALKKSADDRVAAIRSFYDRMLHTKTGNSSGAATGSRQGNDATSSEPSVTGCDQRFEENCALDASLVTTWQAWAKKHNFPVQ